MGFTEQGGGLRPLTAEVQGQQLSTAVYTKLRTNVHSSPSSCVHTGKNGHLGLQQPWHHWVPTSTALPPGQSVSLAASPVYLSPEGEPPSRAPDGGELYVTCLRPSFQGCWESRLLASFLGKWDLKGRKAPSPRPPVCRRPVVEPGGILF